ncbi:hypothetical protein EIN_378760 [Entamoeba invadens IP1]|uniref:Uncharacterized protein n=1 Tax=Entamoeba invadens IP1 TaxID=370355 RepID=A0A0A1TYG8_ENTIV|nr:hypothetical protein EIN_378760 [Entamoeba invadens IP1]ELP83541.1 hypothetical protein EIN_378760 [Entamoeba invadens IP1]|eukprot:XP_004182887.1 hypothetical protein EIN_378760 [Entamoeba invadens IP1]
MRQKQLNNTNIINELTTLSKMACFFGEKNPKFLPKRSREKVGRLKDVVLALLPSSRSSKNSENFETLSIGENMLSTDCNQTTTDSSEKQSKKPCKFASRKLRDYQTCQQGIFIGLLNKFCDITIIKPPKKAVITHQFVKIKTISFNFEDFIDIEEFLQRRCNDHKFDDMKQGCSEKTANRRFQTNKKTEALHLLLDVLGEVGYFFEVNTTKGKKGTMKLQNVERIYQNEKYLFGIDEIYDVGFKINEVMNVSCQSSILKSKKCSLKMNNSCNLFNRPRDGLTLVIKENNVRGCFHLKMFIVTNQKVKGYKHFEGLFAGVKKR